MTKDVCSRCHCLVSGYKMRGTICDWCADDLAHIDDNLAQALGQSSDELNEESLF